AAEQRHRVEGDRELEDVRADRREDVAFAETPPRQTGRRAIDRLDELPIGQAASAWSVDQRRFVCQPPAMPQDKGRQRGVRDRDVGIGAVEDHGGPPDLSTTIVWPLSPILVDASEPANQRAPSCAPAAPRASYGWRIRTDGAPRVAYVSGAG